MPPTKKKPAGRAPPARWTRAELEVLVDCLRSDEFMAAHAKSLPAGEFPVSITIHAACNKDSEYHTLCVGIAKEILEREGSHNNNNQRPFASIASKVLDMHKFVLAKTPDADARQALEALDLEGFVEQKLEAQGSAEMEPEARPASVQRAKARAIAAVTSGWSVWPRCPIEAARSAGPTKMASTPSTAAISGMASTADRLSTCTVTHISRSACS